MKKIREFIDQVGKPGPSIKESREDLNIQPSNISFGEDVRLRNPLLDMETIEGIDSLYFDANADVTLHELQAYSEKFTLQDVENRLKKLRNQLHAISKKLSDVILENQPSYTKELKEVQELQRSLHKAFVICSNGRRFLMSVSVGSTGASLRLLNQQQKRQKLVSLCEALQTIKTLQHTDVRLREMVEEEDYDGAIQLCLECLQAASTYKRYQCITDLSSKLQDTLEIIEEQVDVALSNTCLSFDENLYTKLQYAYQMLGKTQSAIDQLLMHYTTCIHNVAFRTVMRYAEMENSRDNMQKKQYKDICKYAVREIYIPCLLELCKSLWTIMNSYHKTAVWHAQKFAIKCEITDPEVLDYVNRKLAHGRHRVWADVQSRVRTYILSTDLSHFKYDDFISILDIVKRFISIGIDFSKDDSESGEKTSDALNEPLRKQSLSYFRAHHASRMEELLAFLENEAWQPCPVKPSFNVLDMQEFKFLRILDDSALWNSADEPMESKTECGSKYFNLYSTTEEKHPFLDFERGPSVKQTSTTLNYGEYDASDEDDVNDELYQDFVDENTGESPLATSKSHNVVSVYDGPLMTNTALHVLRLCGRYMKMCDVLKPISVDVIMCMCQLFDLYYYSVYKFFASDEGRSRQKTPRLHSTIKHLEETLFLPETSTLTDEEKLNSSSKQETRKIRKPTMSSAARLDNRDNYYGLPERIVATESLVCLAEQFDSLRKYLKQLISSSKKPFLHHFYSQTVRSSPDVRWPVYYSCAGHAFDFYNVVEQMAFVNWDIRDIMSQHNPYVDQLLSCLHMFKTEITDCVRAINFPDAVLRVIWEHVIRICNFSFVEGFSNVKRCTNEGRALMQLDYQQFLMKLEKLTNIKPIPNREFVEAYIKAYYLTESDLEGWMQVHNEYSPKQLSALITCSASTSSSSNRNAKQRMMSLIEDLKIPKMKN